MQNSGDHVGTAIAVDITNHKCSLITRKIGQDVGHELAAGFLLIPTDAGQSHTLAPRFIEAGEKRGRNDVEVAIAVHVSGFGAVRAIVSVDPMELVRQLAVVLNPGHSLVRLELDLVVQSVAVGEKEVEIAVLIEVNGFDPAEAPMRVARREEVLLSRAE